MIIPDLIRRRIGHSPTLVKILENISWLFLDKIIRMGVGLVVGISVARYLGPHQFGLFNYASAFVGLFANLAGLGLQAVVVRNIVQQPESKEKTIGTALALLMVGGLVSYLFTLIGIYLIRPNDNLSILVVSILGSAMLMRASDVASYWFESQVNSRYTVWVQNGVFILFALLKIMLILNGANVVMFAWMAVGEVFVVSILMMAMFSKMGFGVSRLRFQFDLAITLLAESWPQILSSFAIMIYMKIDQVMLGQMLGDDAVGVYSAALRISEIWYFIPMGIAASVFPSILKAKQESEDLYYRRLQQFYDLMVWLAIAIALPMTFVSSALVGFLYGVDFIEAGKVLAIHIWAAVFVFLGIGSAQWFVVEKRQILNLQKTIIGAIINVVLNLYLIPAYGVIGAAWATVVAQASVGLFLDLLQVETHRMFIMKIKAFNPNRIAKLMEF